MKAIVDADTCIGCGMCAEIAPDIYKMEGEKAVTVVEEIPEDKLDEAKNGSEQCPVDAIEVS